MQGGEWAKWTGLCIGPASPRLDYLAISSVVETHEGTLDPTVLDAVLTGEASAGLMQTSKIAGD